MPSTDSPVPRRKLQFARQLLNRYRWMSLRNKIALWAIVAAILIALVSFQWLRPAYRSARMWLFLNMANEAIERKDYNAASLAFRKALLSGNEYPASWKALAEFLEQANSPEVINVWARLATMEPEVASHRYAEIAAALRFGRTSQAEEVFAQIPPAWRNAPEGLRLAAEIAFRRNDVPVAEARLQEILRQVPDDQFARFTLNSLRAGNPDPAISQPARRALEEFAAGNGEYALPARRRIIALEQAAGTLYEADRLAAQLIQQPGATVQDRLLHAQLELATNSLSLPVTIRNLRQYAVDHPEEFGTILSWLLETRFDFDGTRRWLEELPPKFVTDHPEIHGPLLQYYLGSRSFEKAYVLLGDPKSPIGLSPNVLDLARRAIEQDEQGLPSADQTWISALYATEGKSQPLRVLSLLASSRGWTAATGRALTALADAAPGDPSAWWLLVQHENNVRNLPGLYKALNGLLRLNPYDPAVASNWVLAAALVRQADAERLVEVAHRAQAAAPPGDPRAATALAMALLQAGKPAEAVAIIDKMREVDRRDMSRAIYVGAIYAANGRFPEALECFQRSEENAEETFPEERAFRRIWKGVALGEAPSAKEAEQLLIRQENPDVMAQKLSGELRDAQLRRADPAEVQRILGTLKAEAESRQRPPPPEVERLLREVRPQTASPTATPAQP